MQTIRLLFVCVICLWPTGAALAQSKSATAPSPAAEESFRYTKFYSDVTAQADGTEVHHNTLAWIALRSDALDNLKQMTLDYSTSAEKIDILEAYTTKPNGRRIDAARDSFEVQVNGGRKGAAPAFSDQSTVTVVFPDVAVGDTMTIIYDKTIVTPLFPKQFSDLFVFPRRVLYDDARVSFNGPLSLGTRAHNYGLQQTVDRQTNGRQYWTWAWKNEAADHRRTLGAPAGGIGDQPSVALSTFPSYQVLAESYGAQARPKAQVTPQIQALADGITKDIAEPRAQAKALYDWEVANLTYAGNCIGVGAVVPRDLSFVLANKMGDCKDHATLLQALLDAEKIPNTQALIGVNSIYQLPDVPLVEVINHVINYLPGLNLFADATSGMPFGTLPDSLYGKPVLLVDGYRDGTRTPPPPPGRESTKVVGTIDVQADGSARGVLTLYMTAPSVDSYAFRQQLANVTARAQQEAAEEQLKNSGYQGSVVYQKGVIDDKTLVYSQTTTYTIQDFVHPGSPGAIYATPPFAPGIIHGSVAAPHDWAMLPAAEKRTTDFVCSGGQLEESFRITMPKNLNVLAVPNSVRVANPMQEYSATYAQAGQTITVTRQLIDKTPGPTCTPPMETLYEQVAAKIWPDLKAQIVYK